MVVDDPEAVARAVQAELECWLGLRTPVSVVEAGSRPRWELKAWRIADRRRG